jgi:hypothetical protein
MKLQVRISRYKHLILRSQLPTQVFIRNASGFRHRQFRHVTTIERVICFKRGTGGTGGVSCLRRMLDWRSLLRCIAEISPYIENNC